MARKAGNILMPDVRRCSWQALKRTQSSKWVLALAGLCIAVAVLSGCSWTDASGTHHLIVGVGFGIITTTNRPGVDVEDVRVLGGEISPRASGIGWLQQHQVAIDPSLASNVVVSIKASPLALTVKNFDPYSVVTNLQPIPVEERKTSQ